MIRNSFPDRGRRTPVGRRVLRINEVLQRDNGFEPQGTRDGPSLAPIFSPNCLSFHPDAPGQSDGRHRGGGTYGLEAANAKTLLIRNP